MAPVAAALTRLGRPPRLVLTGQHRDLQPADFGLGSYPIHRLLCSGRADPYRHVQDVVKALSLFLGDRSPALLVVHGDTSSALGGALAAKLAGVPLAHVEAGLRSHDLSRPWPEEEFRLAIDSIADLLFAPTALSAANLRREMVRGEIYVTGNTGIDALRSVAQPVERLRGPREPRRLLVTCHRRESWRDGIRSVATALREIAADRSVAIDVVSHPNPALTALMTELTQGVQGVRIVPPTSHSALVAMLVNCDLLLSDSGGLQEEAATLGVPLLVLRERTERPEALVGSRVRLVGTDAGRIVAGVRRELKHIEALPARARFSSPFGDGKAAPRIAALVDSWLETRSAPEAFVTAAE